VVFLVLHYLYTVLCYVEFDLKLGLFLIHHISTVLIISCWCRLPKRELGFIRSVLILSHITSRLDNALMMTWYLREEYNIMCPHAYNMFGLLISSTLI
jgi:uncharacterized membrane protein